MEVKKVLIIANLFHASPRIPILAKYLSDFGWEPTILTVPTTEDPRSQLVFPADFKEKTMARSFPRSFYKNHWIHNYKLLFNKFISEDNIKFTKIDSGLWGGDWGEYGNIIEIRI
ncbi:MAG: hypothetical protein COY73_01870 [Candidatus Nealsonbacteria bacterium CG_4_10_14_0_8_um_filter_37_14]|uniref:Uncharacterized protein n=1 Tax=Candidatus Nealsonbacteria bacterium CG_4_10_14_0_8_um_filter_37_14 TaxID=1974684 RepID=A0A2M7R7J4_9BACT|nr:MAG: hypothetical protein COV69_02130 [Parcubacteria group bacterium CG11_big_fil_rev_8_21_14_0_20_39_14]PIY89119.1 MAG: hypothetical protein COY73_01870 [Candidatus Nealsonbacteria bacterium CG_4_10_14_0_8_um_filter_37_14]